MDQQWRRWSNISDDLNHIEEESGIYRIRIFNILTSQPFTIHRLTGDDNDGILQIGQSKDLKKRLNTFKKVYNGNSGKHAEAKRLYEISHYASFQQCFQNFTIEYSIMNADDLDSAKSKEIIHLENYFQRFGELPPLNHNRPGKKD